MSKQFEIKDMLGQATRDALLLVNNRSAKETSLLTSARFDQLIGRAGVALYVPPDAALLLAFDQSADYDGENYLWFRSRFDEFLYIDRVIVAEDYRRYGIGRMLYAEVFRRAAAIGHTRVVCEVNLIPPNPVSDQFHAALGFKEIGRATIDSDLKTVRYLAAQL